jgi:hypothetical protein
MIARIDQSPKRIHRPHKLSLPRAPGFCLGLMFPTAATDAVAHVANQMTAENDIEESETA